MTQIRSPLQAQIVQWLVQPGAHVRAQEVLLILEAMKMEHEVRADRDGVIGECFFAPGDSVQAGDVLLNIELPVNSVRGLGADLTDENVAPGIASKPSDHPTGTNNAAGLAAGPRADLQRVQARHAFTHDASRPEAVAKRHVMGLRTARENVADLCDEGTFIEYGALAVAAQRSRRSEEDLVRNTPADGMVTGIGNVNQTMFGLDASRVVVMAYDATVLAGTQGMRNHQKTDRMLGLALQPQAAGGAVCRRWWWSSR